MAAASRKGSSSVEVGDGKQEPVRCGECRKVVMDKGIQCEICELWFHCKCENVAEETYKLMNQDKVHYYCGRCDKAVGKLLKVVLDVQARQKKLEEEFHKMQNDIEKRNYVKQEQLEGVVQKFGKDIEEVKQRIIKEKSVMGKGEEEIQKLQTDIKEIKSGLESQLNTTVKEVREDVEESMERERRKLNLIIHGIGDEDAEKDVEMVMNIFGEGLKMDFGRHVEKMVRIGRMVNEQRPRPLRITLKSGEGRREILARAKSLKDSEKFKKFFITPDLTRKQQLVDKELRAQLRKFKSEGEIEAKIKFGKVIKNLQGGRVVVLYPTSQ
jgi:hypothetical protein